MFSARGGSGSGCVIHAEVQRAVAIERRTGGRRFYFLKQREANMTLRLPMVAITLIMSGLLCGCTAGSASAPTESSATSPVLATRAQPTAAATYVQGFYGRYVASRKEGQAAAMVLIRTYVAAWYLPILKAPSIVGADDVECGLRGVPAGWTFTQVGALAGQAVVVVGSQPRGAPQKLWIVITMEPGTRKITGITCAIGGDDVTSTGTKDAATSLSSYYLAARRQGASPGEVIARLVDSGATSSSAYLQQAKYALARRQLAYDPVTCAAPGVPPVPVGAARVVAGGSVGLVMASANRVQALMTVVLGAKGWTVADIACHQPLTGPGS
jgi:hypothetical protein